MAIWSRTYCCCAVPLYNSGIYAILAQFLLVSLLAGVLSFAAPTIVAVSIPSFGPYLFGAFAIAVAVVQVAGFLGVYRERPALFKSYARLNALLVSATLAIALAFIILSAVNHNPAVASCEALFSSQVAATTAAGSLINLGSGNVTSGSGICNIWTWVQLGIMGLLFLIVAFSEAYFLMYQSIYLSEQKADHARYNSVYSTAAEEIRQSGLWDAQSVGRPSGEYNPTAHDRTPSKTSGLRHELSQPEYGDAKLEQGYAGYRDEEPVQGGSRYDGGYRNSMLEGQRHVEGYNAPYVGGQTMGPESYPNARPAFAEPDLAYEERQPHYQQPRY